MQNIKYKNLPVNFDFSHDICWSELPKESKLSSYNISTSGDIIKEKYLIKKRKQKGYIVCTLSNDDGKCSTYQLHRLLALAFIENPENKKTVDHIDRVSDNNKLTNLRWATTKEQGANKRKAIHTRGRPISQFTLEGEFVRKWSHAKEAALELKIDIRTISKCCHGKNKTAGGYKWEFINDKMENEVWKDVPDYPGYKASNYGRIKNKHNKICKGHIQPEEYTHMNAVVDGKNIPITKHEMVCLAFHDLPKNKNLIINHKDGNKLNDKPDNLEWITQGENISHAFRLGLNKGASIPVAKLDKEGNILDKYNSYKEAANKNKINCLSVANACKSGKKSCGYYWKNISDL